MMSFLNRLAGLILIVFMMSACSSTKTTDSWSDQSYKGQIKNVYIIGIAKDDLNRMIFEDSFETSLTKEGIKAIASFKDNLPTNQEIDREDIIQRMRNNSCDSVLLTRVISQRTKGSMSGGRGTYTYTPGPNSGDLTFHKLPKDSYYRSWDSYYSYGRINYVEPARADFVVLTVESVLYDLQTEELIWSAQLETRLEGKFESMVQTFVNEVIRDLRGKNLI